MLHFPTVIGAVAITYNLPSLSAPIRLNGDVVADIFLGKITKWNDARIAALNPGVTLPATDILVVHRSDGSGTTYIFSDYLTAVSTSVEQRRRARARSCRGPSGSAPRATKAWPAR